ncbi:MAG: GNAT family N-acetyltransferase [Acidimicrobiales bacterium]
MDDRDAIHRASKDEDDAVRALFREYAASLDFELSFQGFADELDDPFGSYEVILLSDDGCVALRRIDDQICEMKRLYVRRDARGRHLGRALAEAVVRHAKDAGYLKMKLDTVPSMTAAIALYRSLGFEETEGYRYNPIEGALYLELDLTV